ncbi:MAG: hypothetical protein IJ038_01135 [Clostridia bacterium]|nr:hypothetical protein [Clostridia bacterium]
MAKYNYFEALEELAAGACNAVRSVCGEGASISKKEFTQIRSDCAKTLFSLENSLFSEFLPPLERDNIAAYAHCLSRLIDTAAEHFALSRALGGQRKKNEEEKICLELASEIKNGTSMLRNLKKPGEIPDIQKFRSLLHSGIEAHNAELSKINSGVLPKTYAQSVLSAGRLRIDLSKCFDKLLEIMLNNI